VEAASTSAGVPPDLVWAVMRQESAFSPVAVSRSNAMGLMQVVPSTWDWLAELQGDAPPGDPFDPHVNIRYGTYYLGWLVRYFDGDTELAISSYNRGQGYIRRLFQSSYVRGDKNELYREIDALETREYLQKVAVNLATYRALYPDLRRSAAP
jgi:soluble lytic murein transglycosylase